MSLFHRSERIAIPSAVMLKNCMKITREEIGHVASLARLKLSAEEEEMLTDQLDRILQYVEKLNELDTSNVEPLAHAVDIVNAFREDRLIPWPSKDSLLANAPARENNFFKVPKIIE
jgi:aspartyl-tRNA(Asn)/glutamyl-tRNA(Gln) amidotransferase subunit C